VYRFNKVVLVSLGCLPCTMAMAQPASAPTVDESKLPEWVKRQASSPYKVIIENSAVKLSTKRPAAAAAAAPKVEEARTDTSKTPVAKPAHPTSPAVAATPPSTAAVLPPVASAKPGGTGRPDTTPAGNVAPDGTARTPSDTRSAATPEQIATTNPAPREPEPAAAPEEAELKVIARVEPDIPQRVQTNMRGTAQVVVAFTVNPDGSVSNPVVTSSSNSALNRYTVTAVKAWRFEPIPMARDHMVSFTFTTE
jgi:TonB family protein